MKVLIHDYHFIIEKTMLDRLAATHIPGSNFCGKTRYLLHKVLPILEIDILKDGDQHTRYRTLNEPVAKRALITEGHYRILKKLHADGNHYSMAQILRKIIDYALTRIDELGLHEFLMELSNKEFETKMCENIPLIDESIHMDKKEKRIITYADKYIPILMEFT